MQKLARPLVLTFAILLAAMLLSIGVGSIFIPMKTIFATLWDALRNLPPANAETEKLRIILFTLRLPRTLLMAFTGAALAGSGAAYQGLFRNPLADPYLIGAASGAGLGAVVSLSSKWPSSILGFLAVPLTAFIGAVVTVSIVYSLAKVGKTLPVTNLILAGVAVSSFRNCPDLFPDDQRQRRAAPLAGLAAGRVQSGRLETLDRPAALCSHRAKCTDRHVLPIECPAAWRRAGAAAGGKRSAQPDHHHPGSHTCHCGCRGLHRHHRVCGAGRSAYHAPPVGRGCPAADATLNFRWGSLFC